MSFNNRSKYGIFLSEDRASDRPADPRRIIIGIDPASELAGIGAVDAVSATPIFATTLIGRGKDLRSRLQSLSAAYLAWTRGLPKLLGPLEIVAIAIENPAMGLGRGGRNRHDTAFVLGRAYQVAEQAAALFTDTPIPILEVLPRESSVAVGAALTANKDERNRATALCANGRFVTEPAPGRCVDGPLHGAGPDALDAIAAGIAGWGKLRQCVNEGAGRAAKSSRRRHRGAG